MRPASPDICDDMGKKHRTERSWVKNSLRQQGWHENEFGELQKRMSKAEARRHLLHKRNLLDIQMNIIDMACKEATRVIQEEEDARIFQELEKVIHENQDSAISLW